MQRLLSSAALAAALVLAGCASQKTAEPQIVRGTAADGATTVQVAPERLECQGGPRCPVLAASWTSAKAGQAQLSIGLPGARSDVTGADVHIGGSETVRLRLRVADAGAGAGQPGAAMSTFDVPLRLVDRMAYGSRTWVRVYTADGSSVDESLFSGEQRSRASQALAHFMAAVQSSGGKGAGVEGARGGLFDRLGVGSDK